MAAFSSSADPNKRNCNGEISWQRLYQLLHPLVKHWVYSSHVSCWKGQEVDLVEDIVQEAITRFFNYSQRAERGEVPPIDTPEYLVKAIALNYCRDLKRRERRLMHPATDDYLYREAVDSINLADPSEIAVDKVYQEWLFERLAQNIASFPNKQRKALLIDLAKRMHFAVQPSSLQRAFLRVGIKLQDFRHLVPQNPLKKTRHAASLSLAYKRVAKLYI